MSANQPQRTSPLKISLTLSSQKLLNKLADEQYAGNRSACIRAAIEDHSRSINGEGEVAIKHLKNEIERLVEKVEELENAHEQPETPDEPLETPVQNVAYVEDNQSSDKHTTDVYRTLKTLEDVECTVDQLASELDLSVVEVSDTLKVLIDRGLVSCRDLQGQEVFHVAGISGRGDN